MVHVCIRLSSLDVVSQPAPLPPELVGLDDATLADLPAALDPVPPQFEGVGFWPVDFLPVQFDPRAQTTTGEFTLAVDAERKRVAATPIVRDLTAEEIAALPPPPEPVPAILGKGEFLDLFLAAGVPLAKIRAASDDPALADFWFALDRFYSQIRRDHPSTRDGVAAMVALGHIEAAAAEKVFASWPVL